MSPLVAVTWVGEASGSKAVAAALACAGSDPDRPGLLIDLGGKAPRPTLVASTGARELEERLALHLPQGLAASRGQTCHLALGADPAEFDELRAVLALVRDSVAVVHLAPALLRRALDEPAIPVSAALIRADLRTDRALVALAVRDLIGSGIRVRVIKEGLPWVSARRALFGALPPSAPGGLPTRLSRSLLESEDQLEHACYIDPDDEKADPTRAPQRERQSDESAGRRGGLHRHPQRQAGR